MKVAACPSLSPSGNGTPRCDATTTSSTYPPMPTLTKSRSPIRRSATSAPISVTRPTTSIPGVNGAGIFTW